MGGNLSLVAEFPDRAPVVLSGISDDEAFPIEIAAAAGMPSSSRSNSPAHGNEASRSNPQCGP
jgi:hypothetical protein